MSEAEKMSESDQLCDVIIHSLVEEDVLEAMIKLNRLEKLGFETLTLENFKEAYDARKNRHSPLRGANSEKHFYYNVFIDGSKKKYSQLTHYFMISLMKLGKIKKQCLSSTKSLFQAACTQLVVKAVGKNNLSVLTFIHEHYNSWDIIDVMLAFYTVDWISLLEKYIAAMNSVTELMQTPTSIVANQSKLSKMIAEGSQEGSGRKRKTKQRRHRSRRSMRGKKGR
jgi:hypothetical protein